MPATRSREIERFTCACLQLDDTLGVLRLRDALVGTGIGGELGPNRQLQTRRDLREVGKRGRRSCRLLLCGISAHVGNNSIGRLHHLYALRLRTCRLLGTGPLLARTRLDALVIRTLG